MTSSTEIDASDQQEAPDAAGELVTTSVPQHGRWLARVDLISAALIVGLLIAGTTWSVRMGGPPTFDSALLEFKARGVGDYWPLLGAYSRFGWDHPGPAYIYYLAASFNVLGRSPWALAVASAVWQILMVLTAWWVARRRDRVLGSLVLLTAIGLLVVLTPGKITEIWNPYVGIVAVLTLIVLSWDASQTGRWGAVLLLPLGSFLVQSHVGYTPVVAAVSATGILLALLTTRHRRRSAETNARSDPTVSPASPRLARYWAIGIGITVLMWLPAVYAELTTNPGNVQQLLNFSGGEHLGIAAAIGELTNAFSWLPSWARVDGWLFGSLAVPWLLVLPIAATLLAARSSSGRQLAALLIAGSAVVSSGLAISQIQGLPVRYLALYLAGSAASLLVFSAWIVIVAIPVLDRSRELVTAAVSVMAVLLATAVAVNMWPPPTEQRILAEAARQLSRQIAEYEGVPERGVHLTYDSFLAGGVLLGVAVELSQRGIDVQIPDAERGDYRMGGEPGNRIVLQVHEMSLADYDSPGLDRDVVARFELLDQSDLEVVADFVRQSTDLGDMLQDDPDNVELAVRVLHVLEQKSKWLDGRISLLVRRQD